MLEVKRDEFWKSTLGHRSFMAYSISVISSASYPTIYFFWNIIAQFFSIHLDLFQLIWLQRTLSAFT